MALLVLDFVVEFVCGAGFTVLFEHNFVVALVIVCRDVFAVMCLYGLMVFFVHGSDFKFVCGGVFEVVIVSLGGGVERAVVVGLYTFNGVILGENVLAVVFGGINSEGLVMVIGRYGFVDAIECRNGLVDGICGSERA